MEKYISPLEGKTHHFLHEAGFTVSDGWFGEVWPADPPKNYPINESTGFPYPVAMLSSEGDIRFVNQDNLLISQYHSKLKTLLGLDTPGRVNYGSDNNEREEV